LIELVAHNPPTQISGIGRYCRELFEHLKDNVEICMAYPRFPPLSERFTILRNFPLGVVDHRPNNLVHFTQIMGCAQMLWNPIHPVIATVHDLGVLVCAEDEPLFTKFDRKILSLQLRGLVKADQFIVHSTRTKNDLINKLGVLNSVINIVPSSINIENFRIIDSPYELVRKQYCLHKRANQIDLIYVGSELPRKNLCTILESMEILIKTGTNVRLLKIGGSGGQRWRDNFLQLIHRFKLNDSVVIFDYVPEKDLPYLYNFSDIAITSTLLEGGFAWTIMEALACGKPAIASPAALIPDAAKDVVHVVENNQPIDFANGIQKIGANIINCKSEICIKARNIISKYTWSNEISETIKVYKKVGEII